MNKDKRSLPRIMEEENSPPNRKRAALSESPDDAVSLLLLLSRGPCNPGQSARTLSAPPQLPQLVGTLGHYRRRKNSSSRLGTLGRVVRFAPQGHMHVVSHVSDDEDEREPATTFSSSSLKTSRWFASSQTSTRHTIDESPAIDEISNIPLFSMALAPPPRLPNVEFGTIVGAGKSRD